MKKFAALLCVVASSVLCHADGLPLGVASAYNLFAIGSVDAHGNTLLAGTVNDSADVTGRVAAADMVLAGTTVGSSLNSDPYGSAAQFVLVSPNGLQLGANFNVNTHGNVYAPGTNGNINFNRGGSRVTSGGSGIDFNSVRTQLDAEAMSLAGLSANGQALGTN